MVEAQKQKEINIKFAVGEDRLGDSPQTFAEARWYIGTNFVSSMLPQLKQATDNQADFWKIVIKVECNNVSQVEQQIKEMVQKFKQGLFLDVQKNFNEQISFINDVIYYTLTFKPELIQEFETNANKVLGFTSQFDNIDSEVNFSVYHCSTIDHILQVMQNKGPYVNEFLKGLLAQVQARGPEENLQKLIKEAINFVPQQAKFLFITMWLFKQQNIEFVFESAEQLSEKLKTKFKVPALPLPKKSEIPPQLQEFCTTFLNLQNHFQSKVQFYFITKFVAAEAMYNIPGFNKLFEVILNNE